MRCTTYSVVRGGSIRRGRCQGVPRPATQTCSHPSCSPLLAVSIGPMVGDGRRLEVAEGKPEWISFHSDVFELQGFDILAPTRTNVQVSSQRSRRSFFVTALRVRPAPRLNNPVHPRPSTLDSTLDTRHSTRHFGTSPSSAPVLFVDFSNVPLTSESGRSRCSCLGPGSYVLASTCCSLRASTTTTSPQYIPDVVHRVKLVCATPAPLHSTCAYENKIKAVKDTVVGFPDNCS